MKTNQIVERWKIVPTAVDYVNHGHLHTDFLFVWVWLFGLFWVKRNQRVYTAWQMTETSWGPGLSEQPTWGKRIMAATARALAVCNPPVWSELLPWQHPEVPDKLIPGGSPWFSLCSPLVSQHEYILWFTENGFIPIMVSLEKLMFSLPLSLVPCLLRSL